MATGKVKIFATTTALFAVCAIIFFTLAITAIGKYTAQLKKAIGTGEEYLEVGEGTILKDLLNTLFVQKKTAFENIVFSTEGVFLDAVLIILNGQQVAYDSPEVLNERDEITIMSPIAGG